jgi:hypothetical protein
MTDVIPKNIISGIIYNLNKKKVIDGYMDLNLTDSFKKINQGNKLFELCAVATM